MYRSIVNWAKPQASALSAAGRSSAGMKPASLQMRYCGGIVGGLAWPGLPRSFDRLFYLLFYLFIYLIIDLSALCPPED